jgi:hypothetical protein
MEKYLIIEYKNNKFEVLGNVNLPENLELDKNYFLNIKDNNHILTNILTLKIYSENNPITIFLGIGYLLYKTLNNTKLGYPIHSISHYTMNIIDDKNTIKHKFFQELSMNKINLKSHFRKDKISKILEENKD